CSVYAVRIAFGTFRVFFFQAEDGIRDFHVTGVQTCALPISLEHVFVSDSAWFLVGNRGERAVKSPFSLMGFRYEENNSASILGRSEERRVGKEGRFRWSPCCYRVQVRWGRGMRSAAGRWWVV